MQNFFHSLRRNSVFPRSSVLLAALAPGAFAGGETCGKPGLDVFPATHPYGPVVSDDGVYDHIESHFDVPLTYRFTLDGLSHEKSLVIAPNHLTFAVFGANQLLAPVPLGNCADLWLQPNLGPAIVVPNSLELEGTLSPAGIAPHPSIDLYAQALSVDLTDPTLPLSMSDLALIRYEQPPYQGDPTTMQDYGCYYFGTYTWDAGDGVGAVRGRVYWPSVCGDGTQDPPEALPLVLICHGDGHDYTDYRYLQGHLARNGFICASIEFGNELSNVERAERIRTYLGFLRNHWSKKEFVQNNIALMGHSRGGEAVLTAARKLVDDWGTDHDINAVISLAPTDSDPNGGTEGLESLSGNDAESLLVIAGSMDEDVFGYCISGDGPTCGLFPIKPQATGFSIYDRAGSEWSTEFALSGSSVVTKSMLFVEGCDHNRWRDQPCSDPGAFQLHAPLDCDVHHDVLKGYVNAFCRWRLRGEDDMKPYFTGEWTPATVADHGPRIQTQFSEGSGRRVLDNFEAGGFANATLGTVQADLQIDVLSESAAYLRGDFSSPHDTDVAHLRWWGNPLFVDPLIRWTMPAGQGLFGSDYNDFSKFEHLSLRIGLMHDAAWNPADEPTNFFVGLRGQNGTNSRRVWANAFTDLSYPDESTVVTIFGWTVHAPKSSMRTVRIPLSYFEGVDLTQIDSVDVWFGDDEHLQGEVILDSLELVP